MKTLADEERNFRGLVIPPGCGLIQQREMVRSFYAGASSMLKIMFDISHVAMLEGKDAADAQMSAVQAELDAFVDKVQRGDA